MDFKSFHKLEPGDLVEYEHVMWTVIDIRTADDRSTVVQLDHDGRRVHLGLGFGKTHCVRVHGPHYAICAACGDLYPCRHIENERLIERNVNLLRYICIVCQKDSRGKRSASIQTDTPDGRVITYYHTGKGTRCRKAYILAIQDNHDALARLRHEDDYFASITRRRKKS